MGPKEKQKAERRHKITPFLLSFFSLDNVTMNPPCLNAFHYSTICKKEKTVLRISRYSDDEERSEEKYIEKPLNIGYNKTIRIGG